MAVTEASPREEFYISDNHYHLGQLEDPVAAVADDLGPILISVSRRLVSDNGSAALKRVIEAGQSCTAKTAMRCSKPIPNPGGPSKELAA